MKVCQLCAVDFTLAKFLLPLVDAMEARGWHVTSACSDGPQARALRARGYRIEPVPIARSLDPLAALRAFAALVRFFRRERFDVVHVHTPVAALVGRAAARVARVPLVVYTAHGFYFHDDMPAWKYRAFLGLEQVAGAWTDLLFTQSTEDARTAGARRILPADRVLAIGNGVDPSRFDPAAGVRPAARERLGIPAGARVVGLIGRQVREKGVAEFLRAAGRLADREDLWFLLVGERLPSDHAAGVEAELAEARAALGSRLVVTGMRDDIPALLAAMDVFCLPSWREGMPRTIIEAMMMGLPVVATDIRGSREEVVHGETGLVVPVRSPEALAAALGRLADDPVLARAMGSAGRARALALYDESRVVDLQLERISREARARGLLPSDRAEPRSAGHPR